MSKHGDDSPSRVSHTKSDLPEKKEADAPEQSDWEEVDQVTFAVDSSNIHLLTNLNEEEANSP